MEGPAVCLKVGESLVAVAPVPEGLWHGGGFRAKGPFDISHSGLAPGWFEDAPLALTAEIEPLRRPGLGIRTHF